ncbi:MAG TPA: CaiB/BaiF CoA-transferase family protein [Rhizomicrobium sp.]|nr:CaiB/BaiF CoA-transferase family protein [Rhizomicrobium sp.]
MSNRAKPLDGVRVLDFTHAAAGPFTTMFLGDLGAEIIKIEKPGHGDGARTMGRPVAGLEKGNSEYHVALNRGKKSVVLDLGSKDGAEITRRLAANCDIVVQNFRPGVMERLGLGFEALRALRKGLIYCSISAFGSKGPWSEMPANDIIVQGVSGIMSITGEPDGNPVRVGSPISDLSTGMFALSGVLAALHARDNHPEGQHIEVSMLEATLNLMCNYIPGIMKMGLTIPRVGSGHAQIVPYQAFVCKDGRYVIVGAFTREFWQRLAKTVGHAEWITDTRFATNAARLANRSALVSALEEIFRARTRDEWIAVLGDADIPASPLLELHEAVCSPQVQQNESLITLGEGETAVQVVRSPMHCSAWDETPTTPAPSLGHDSRAVLADVLGLSTQDIDALERKGAFGSHE